MKLLLQIRKIKWWSWWLIIWIFMSLFHKYIVNDLPLIAKSEDKITFPVFLESMYSWGLISHNPRLKKHDPVLNALVPLSPYEVSYESSLQPPGQSRHLLGTDRIGRDVLSIVVYGSKNALLVGILAVILSLGIAIVVGGIAGYFYRDNIRLSPAAMLSILLWIFIGGFYFFYSYKREAYGLASLVLPIALVGGLASYHLTKGILAKWVIPLGDFADRIIELREMIPGIFLVLASLSLFTEASIWNVVLIIGLIGWSNLARFIRAEIIKARSSDYYKSAQSLGLPGLKIFRHHLLPNVLDPVFSIIAFSISSAILLEASLSFLGIGIPIEEPTWGGLLAEARRTNAWWIAIFPGICIFLTLLSLQRLADYWQSKRTGQG